MIRMVGAFTREASHGGPMADAVTTRGTRPPVAADLQRLFRLVIALATLVCACVTIPSLGVANLALPIEAMATPSRSVAAAPWEFAHEAGWHQQHGVERPIVALEAVESDADGDGDAPCDLREDATTAVRAAPRASEAGRLLRGEPRRDPSRFAIEASLARGPPA